MRKMLINTGRDDTVKRKAIIIVLFALGILCRISASFIRFVITSDIPVSYTASEALTVQIIYVISTIFFLFALSIFQTNKARIVTGGMFALMFVFGIIVFNLHMDGEYYNSSYAQLQISSLLNSALLMVYSFFLVIKSRIEN